MGRVISWAAAAAVVVLAAMHSPATGQQPGAGPANPRDVTSLRAENRELRRQLTQQKAQVAALEQEIRRLEAALGRPPAPAPLLDPVGVAPPARSALGTATGPDAGAGDPTGGEPVDLILPGPNYRPKKREAPKRVVFVLDYSGSMIDKVQAVREQVVKAAGRMPAGGTFNVLLGADGRAESFRPQPVPVDAAALADLHQFLGEHKTHGTSDLIPAVQLAFQQRADTVWVVTDGDMPDSIKFLDALRALNREGRVQVNTLVAGDKRELANTFPAFLVLMGRVAAEHGGRCVDLAGAPIVVRPPPDADARPAVGQPGGGRGPARGPVDVPRGPSIFDIAND